MDLVEFWSVRIILATMPENIFELNFRTEGAWRKALDKIRAAREVAPFMTTNSWFWKNKSKSELLEIADDFGVTLSLQTKIISAVQDGKHSDYHSRAIDIGDTQESIAQAYESTMTKKAGIVGSKG